jgi:hypothetical protein
MFFCPWLAEPDGNTMPPIRDIGQAFSFGYPARRGSGCLFGGSDCLLHFANPTTNITAALAGSVTFFTVAGWNTRDQLSAVAVTSRAENSPLAVAFRT